MALHEASYQGNAQFIYLLRNTICLPVGGRTTPNSDDDQTGHTAEEVSISEKARMELALNLLKRPPFFARTEHLIPTSSHSIFALFSLPQRIHLL